MTTAEKYKAILRQLNLQAEDIAQMFGYKNAGSLANSSAKERIQSGVVALFEHIGEHQVQFFQIESEKDSK